jgi:hypothetical protein
MKFRLPGESCGEELLDRWRKLPACDLAYNLPCDPACIPDWTLGSGTLRIIETAVHMSFNSQLKYVETPVLSSLIPWSPAGGAAIMPTSAEVGK